MGNDAGRDANQFSHMSPSEFKGGREEVKREELNQQSRRLLSVSASTISDSQRVGEVGGDHRLRVCMCLRFLAHYQRETSAAC